MSKNGAQQYHVGVDIGGTFTDLVITDDQANTHRAKALTTPGNYTQGIMNAIGKACETEIGVSELLEKTALFINGTTIVTNAIAEMKGQRVGVITTKGFGDTLRIARSARTNDYNMQTQIPLPEIVSRDCIEEVDERVDSAGQVLVKLDPAQVRAAVKNLVEDKKVEALAVCLLWSFKHPAHEQEIKRIAQEMYPSLYVSISYEIFPVAREYERMVTTVFNSFTGGGVAKYATELEKELGNAGLKVPVGLMQSIGGVLSTEEAKIKPIQLINSGPVGGAIGANNLGKALGIKNIITADMGGTSFDTALIKDNQLGLAHRAEINRFFTGLSMVDISTIGAGGGSICWLDARGAPRVGPRSAGAVPGPACYGRGGTEPTVTDLAVALNFIDPSYFLGGAMKLDKKAAEAAIMEKIGEPLGWGVMEAASGLYKIVIDTMSNAVRSVSIEKGHDPREFTMVTYGGASALYIAQICRNLGIKKIVIPSNCAVFSAYGLLWAESTRSYVQTANWNVPRGSIAQVNELFQQLSEEARNKLLKDGFKPEQIEVIREGDFKFNGQAFEVTIPVPSRPMTDDDRPVLTQQFTETYERLYGEDTAWVGTEVMMLNCRVTGIGHTEKPKIREYPSNSADPALSLVGQRDVFVPDRNAHATIPIYDDRKIHPGMLIKGPAIIEVVDTTIFVPDDAIVSMDKFRNYVMEVQEAEMTVTTAGRKLTKDYDPVTAEVIQMRLLNIVSEMATTVIRTSGSPVLTEAMDFSTALFDVNLEHVGFSGYVIAHLGSSLIGVRSVVDAYSRDEIFPGDQFICNDPHTSGAIHEGDVAIISPMFYKNELVGWSFANAHVLDVGGMSPGGWAPVAWDCYSEAIRFPAMKIVEKGRFIKDMQRLILNNVRLPAVLNDIKSLISANITCQRRLTEVLDKYGVEEYRRYCAINKDLSEELLRSRIAKIPDGVYVTNDWAEYDGHGVDSLVKVACRLVVDGSDLILDFTGSDVQSDGFINAGYGAMVGLVGALIMLCLTYDIPINAGIMRAVKMQLGPAGTVINPVIPAPVSCGHMEGSSKAGRAVSELLVKAMQFSEDSGIRARASAMGINAWPGNAWIGMDQFGNYTAFAVMDCGSGGIGAQSTGDGLDIGSYEAQLNNGIPDVETNESLYPMLYLWRKLNTDCAGPGFNRSGQGLDLAWVPWGTPGLIGTLENACHAVPSRGMLGGYPGGTNSFNVIRNSKVEEFFKEGKRLPSLPDVGGDHEMLIDHIAGVPLGPWQVFRQLTGGGGGLGDPILRRPGRVEKDVRSGFISLKMAENAYGVIIDPATGKADEAATAKKRAAIIENRLGRKPEGQLKEIDEFMPPLTIVNSSGAKSFVCNHCGRVLCSADKNWKEQTITTEQEAASRLTEFGIDIKTRQNPRMILREYCCPSCGVLFETNLYTEGQPIPFDIRLGVREEVPGAGPV